MEIDEPIAEQTFCGRRGIQLHASKDWIELVQLVAFLFDEISKAEHVDKKNERRFKGLCHVVEKNSKFLRIRSDAPAGHFLASTIAAMVSWSARRKMQLVAPVAFAVSVAQVIVFKLRTGGQAVVMTGCSDAGSSAGIRFLSAASRSENGREPLLTVDQEPARDLG